MEAFPAAPPPALKEAIALTVMPSRARALREGPLPDGITMLLRIAAGDLDAQREAMDASDRSAQVVKDASGFFIEQMLLFPEADSYRVLGARPNPCSRCWVTVALKPEFNCGLRLVNGLFDVTRVLLNPTDRFAPH